MGVSHDAIPGVTRTDTVIPRPWACLHHDRRGAAAIEALIVFPIHVVIMCLIVQFAHYMVALEMVQYAAFAACRTALVADPVGSPGDAEKSAKHICDMIDLRFGGTTIHHPTGGHFLKDKPISVSVSHSAGMGQDADVEVTVTADFPLVVPLARDIFLGGGETVPITQTCVLKRPWK